MTKAIPVVYSLILAKLAFDIVKHQIASEKLEYFGIQSIEQRLVYFKQYLSDRQQVVMMNNATSFC